MFTLAQISHRRLRSSFSFACNSMLAATLASALACAIVPATIVLAQQQPAAPQSADDKLLYIGAITADNVYVRSGQGDSYYPFYKVNRGDFVKVTEEKFGYVRVTVAGPAFRDAYGYIKHPKGDTSKLRLAPDTKSAVTLGRVDVLAPNLDSGGQAKDSWKTLVRLPADQNINVLESTELGDDVIYKVSLPSSASGWISAQFVPRASAEDAEMFKQILAGKIESPKPQAAPTPDETLGAQDANVRQASNTAAGADPNAPQQPTTGETAPPESLSETAPPEVAAINATQPEQPPQPTFEDLEQRFNQLRKEPIETAEVLPLRDLYKELAERNPNDRRLPRACQARIDQLEVWSELQSKRQEVMAARDRMKATAEETDAARAAIERSAEYTAVGRIASSTIYDGTSLPKLFRIQDPATGRTIAYLKPDADYALANRIDVIVGIVGDKSYDESLRLNLITPRRIETLSPERTRGSAGANGPKDTEDK